MNRNEKVKSNPELKTLLVQGWMVVLGLMMLFRFWLVKTEAFWLLKLDVYKGDETVSLVKVSLGRDGIVSLLMAAWLLFVYGNLIIRYKKRKASSTLKSKTDSQPQDQPNPHTLGPVV